MPTKHPHIKVILPPAQLAEVTAEARQQGISAAELIRKMLASAGIISDPHIQHGGDRRK